MTLSQGPDSVGIRAGLPVGSPAKLVDVESRNSLVICRGIVCGLERKALFTPLSYDILI